MFHLIKGASTVTLETALTVLQFGWVTIEQLRYANAWRQRQCPRIGKLALISGKLTSPQVLTVLAEQRALGKTFGQTAVELGLLNQADVYELLSLQATKIPDLADSLVTLAFITREQADMAAKHDKALELSASTAVDLEHVVVS